MVATLRLPNATAILLAMTRLLSRLDRAASALTFAAWVSVCTAAPEFIWRGMRVALGHVGPADLYSALLIGLILAFFIEPMLERLRGLAAGHDAPSPKAARPILFDAALGLAFALTAVCLHEAMTALLAKGHRGVHAGGGTGLDVGLSLTLAWALVPFATTLAWLCAARPWLAWIIGLLAAWSAAAAGELFDWSRLDIVTTTIPCLPILVLGMREMRRAAGSENPMRRCLRVVAVVATIWLGLSLAIDTALDAAHLKRYSLYSPTAFWVDARFYLGWVLGLLLAPEPPAPNAASPTGST